MKESQKFKKRYISPQIAICQVINNDHLLTTSLEGGHNPAQPGGNVGDAKQGFFDEEWELEENRNNP